MSSPQDYDGVALAVPVTFGYALKSPHETPWFFAGALARTLARSGLAKQQVDGMTVSSYTLRPDHSASLAETLDMAPRFLVDIPFGGASGVVALRRAARAVQCGDARVVACLAADVVPQGLGLGPNFSRLSRDHVYPYGAGGANSVFALITDRYMRTHGVSREDFGRLCIAMRANALFGKGSLYREPLTMEAYLAARPVSEPLHLFDCVRRCCGAEGFLVMEAGRARALKLPHVRIAGAVERHNALRQDPVQAAVLPQDDVQALFAQAGVAPSDLDFVQAYDDYPVIVMLQLESLGLCEPGGAAAFLRTRTLSRGGELPLNTNGGMLGIGQAGAAGGFCGVTEAIRQLTGEAGGTQVPGARLGLVSCYGTVNYDRGICASAAVLQSGADA